MNMYTFHFDDYVLDYFLELEHLTRDQFIKYYNFNNLVASKDKYKNGYITMKSGIILPFDFEQLDGIKISHHNDSIFYLSGIPMTKYQYDQLISHSDIDHLRIMTFNLGYNIMADHLDGSEIRQVLNCRSKYGRSDKSDISTCSYNAAKLLSEYNLFGLQEVNRKYQQQFQEVIQETNPNANYQFLSSYYFGDNGVVIGFDINVTGEGIMITPNNYLFPLYEAIDRRGVQAVWFERLQLLFINIHVPQGIELKANLELLGNELSQMIEEHPKRIIMVGDFNDSLGSLVNEPIKMFDMELIVPKKLLTCCTDCNYIYPGDYIFDSHNNKQHPSGTSSYYGYPKGYVRNELIMSDHDPVVLLDYYK